MFNLKLYKAISGEEIFVNNSGRKDYLCIRKLYSKHTEEDYLVVLELEQENRNYEYKNNDIEITTKEDKIMIYDDGKIMVCKVKSIETDDNKYSDELYNMVIMFNVEKEYASESDINYVYSEEDLQECMDEMMIFAEIDRNVDIS